MKNILTFELGDVVYDPYYNFTGIITEFKKDFIILENPKTGHTCTSRLRTNSANSLKIFYLQMISKKDEYEEIKNEVFFSDKEWIAK